MRSRRVVVGGVGAKHALELATTDDQQPVETLGAHRTDESLRVDVRLWRPDRRLDHLDRFAAEHLIEGRAERAVALVDQESCPLETPVKLRLRAAG